MRVLLVVPLLAACGSHPSASPPDARPDASAVGFDAPVLLAPWDVPAGWRSEMFPFPLPFAPQLAHQGVEELRFPPGVFDLFSTNYWSYAFAWRLTDPAALDASTLSAELTTYYRGLLVSADAGHLITMPDAIVVHAVAATDGSFALDAHVFDAFNQAQPVDLTGTARRAACGTGALWVVDVSPPDSTFIRAQLDQLAALARCGQPPP